MDELRQHCEHENECGRVGQVADHALPNGARQASLLGRDDAVCFRFVAHEQELCPDCNEVRRSEHLQQAIRDRRGRD
jgi:hypothetical protein